MAGLDHFYFRFVFRSI